MAKKRLPTIKEAFLNETLPRTGDLTQKFDPSDKDIDSAVGQISQGTEKATGPMDKPSMTHGLEFDDKDIKGSISALPEAPKDPGDDESLKPGSEINLEPVDLKALGLTDDETSSEPRDERSKEVDAEMEAFKSLLLGEDDDEGFDAAYSKRDKTDELDEPFHNEGCDMNEGCGCGSAPPEHGEEPHGAEGACGEGSCGGMPTALGPPETFVIKIITDDDVENLGGESSPSLNSREPGAAGGPDFKEDFPDWLEVNDQEAQRADTAKKKKDSDKAAADAAWDAGQPARDAALDKWTANEKDRRRKQAHDAKLTTKIGKGIDNAFGKVKNAFKKEEINEARWQQLAGIKVNKDKPQD